MVSRFRRYIARVGFPVAFFLLGIQGFAYHTGPIQITSGGFADLPEYWSGTNCVLEFSCQVEADPGEPAPVAGMIWGYDFLLNGEMVGSWRKGLLQPYVLSVADTVQFDSSHWSHGTSVVATVIVYATDGTQTHQSDALIVKNRLALAVQKDGLADSQHSQISSSWLSRNYAVTTLANTTWTKSDLREHLLNATGFSILTHGAWDTISGARLVDNNHIPGGPNPDFWRLYDSVAHGGFFSAESARIQAIGEGSTPNDSVLPPYNQGSPVIGISFLGSCESNHDYGFHLGLSWPLGTRYYPEPFYFDLNEATVGYSSLPDERHPKFGPMAYSELAFWTWLADGFTASEARDEALAEYNSVVASSGSGGPPGSSSQPVELEIEDLELWGDANARLKSVYTGAASTADDRGDWFR